MKPLGLGFPLAMDATSAVRPATAAQVRAEMADFREFGRATDSRILITEDGAEVPVFINEFWTSRQRAAHSLHEISYRACFKPQLPRFFIERFSAPGDLIYDPFMGRGTTLLEAALLGRRIAGCDINPIGSVLVGPRLAPVTGEAVAERLAGLNLCWTGEVWKELEVFYHPGTLRELTALRAYLLGRKEAGADDDVDRWIQMVAVNRLTGHSPGFFSVYTLPPNQAVTLDSQRRINAQRAQVPDYRDIKKLILRKTRRLLSDVEGGVPNVDKIEPVLLTRSCDDTPELRDESVDLVVTSPPFLDTIDYATDNWLRGWFCGVDTAGLPIWRCRRLEQWRDAMVRVFRELRRVLRPGGHVAFEVGEIRSGAVCLEATVADVARAAGFEVEWILVNAQEFTKTSNCWGVANKVRGTNTNRVVLLRKPPAD